MANGNIRKNLFARLLVLAALSCLLWLPLPSLAGEVAIGDYTLVISKRITRTVYENTYKADVSNGGTADATITARLTSTAAHITVVEGALSFGDVPIGATVESSDTFTVRHDRRKPFDEAALVWATQAIPLPPLSSTTTNPNAVWIAKDAALIKLDTASGRMFFEQPFSEVLMPIVRDAETGVVWALGVSTLYNIQPTGEVTPAALALPAEPASLLATVPGSAMAWIGRGATLYRVGKDGTMTLQPVALQAPIKDLLAEGLHGYIWVATETGVIAYDGATGEEKISLPLPAGLSPQQLAFDEQLDAIWVASANALGLYAVDGTVQLSLAQSGIKHIASDGHGGVWVEAAGQLLYMDRNGALRFSLNLAAVFTQGSVLRQLVANPSDRSAWLATAQELVQIKADSTVGHRHTVQGRIQALTLFVDIKPPLLRVTSPAQAAYVNTRTPSIVVALDEKGSGIDQSSFELRLDGVATSAKCEFKTAEVTCVPSVPLPEGSVKLKTATRDLAGNAGESAEVFFTIDATAPQITVDAPADGFLTNVSTVQLSGRLSEAASLSANGSPLSLDTNNVFTRDLALLEGANAFLLSATDSAGNRTERLIQIVRDSVAPVAPASDRIAVSDIQNGAVTVTGAASAAEPGAQITLTNTRTGASATTTAAANGGFSLQLSASIGDVLKILVRDAAGNVSPATNVTAGKPPGDLPPDPATVAPATDPTVATDVATATAFLYTGANPIQTGVAPGTLELKRVAVLRGKVTRRDGSALTAVKISVLGHPEFGQTLTRADGMFDLAVNGGGLLTVDYQKPGFLPVQRQVNVPWQDFVVLPDVVMIPLDSAVTTIAMNAAAMQVARGNATTDADGTRRATLLIPQGTTANLVLPNGTTQPVTSLNVRATEYTVGTNGTRAMPAVLPLNSGYTYAVELSADEAIAAGAASVSFSQPIASYTENFLAFPVGGAVPAGYYDRVKAVWVPSLDGRVIRITAINAGVATVDSVGTGSLPALVLTTAELQQLASLYGVGQELWRVPVTHFTPWDYNWPFGPPADAIAPSETSVVDAGQIDDPTCSAGSIIECENQTLGETVGLVGTPYTLNYRSTRTPGFAAARKLRILLTGATVPASLVRIELDVQVAGRSFPQTFGAGPNRQTVFSWDGVDAYGRTLQGSQPATVKISYVYGTVFQAPGAFAASFASFGGVALSGSRPRNEITITRTFETSIGSLDARAFGIGGWSLSSHHAYDFTAQVLQLGTGERRSAETLGRVITTVAGSAGPSAFTGDGFQATQARLNFPEAVAVAPDGSLYIADTNNNRIRRVGLDGVINTIAGTGDGGVRGDGGPALLAHIGTPDSLAFAPDGSLYVGQSASARVRRIAPNGIITTVAGTGFGGFSGDGGPATLATLRLPRGIAVGPDGSLYIADNLNHRVRRVGVDGIITTVAGNGADGGGRSVGPAIGATLAEPNNVAVGPDGTLYISKGSGDTVLSLAADGILRHVAGSCVSSVGAFCTFAGDGGPAGAAVLFRPKGLAVGRDGSLYIGETFISNRVRRVGADGIITTVAGTDGFGPSTGDGGPATRARVHIPAGLAVGPDGALYIAERSDNHRIRRVGSALAGLSVNEHAVASEDGSQLYVFNGSGRHLRTLDALTNATLLEFSYDPKGRLASVTEKTGGTDNVTTIQRDASGSPASIAAPFGQVTTLAVDGNSFLASITNPASEQVQLASTSGGLLTSFTDARGKTSAYLYDADGRLTRNNDAATGFQTLARSELPVGFSVARSTALRRTTSYQIDNLPGSIRKRTIIAPDATQMLIEEDFDAGTRKLTSPDATVTNFERGPDPRFGMQAPIAKSLSIAVPGGPTLTASSTQSAVLSDPTDILSLTSLTNTATVDGRTTTSTYTAATKTEVTTTPAGRTVTLSSDTLGRPVQMQAGGLAPEAFTYDARGRLASVTRGSGAGARTFVFAYNPQGFVSTITDPLGRIVLFAHDAAGRVISKTLPDGSVVGVGYDAAGNVTSVTPPGRPAHTFAYSDRDELTLATPPVVAGAGPSNFAYNVDRQDVSTVRPDNRSVTSGYDAAGRWASRVFATAGVTTGSDTFSYDGAGRISSVAAASGVTTNYAYAGSLLSSESWTGATVGSVAFGYDTSLRLASQSVNGANTIAFGYDSDSLLTNAGDLAIARDPQHGLATGSTLGVVGTTTSYNGFGETSGFTATAGATSLYDVNYVRDGIGRIQQKTETIGGVTDTYVYTYDLVGQLTLVTKNGAAAESYGYDSNGNRATANVAGSSVTASYDAQDRLTAYGATGFGYTAAGELESRTAGGQTTTYQYDAIGNLLGVTLPSGTAITYVVDGLSRRVGKRVNGTLVQGLLYGDRLRPVAELDGTGALVSRFVYAGRHVPAYVIKGGVAHRVVTDNVGSVRLVVNATTGVITQRIDYDTFGNVIADTNPGFQPFGFAGGIFDAATGLVRFGARDYDPQIGRWAAKDPIGFGGGDANLYRYVRNNPVNRVDPSGKALRDEIERAQSMLDDITDTFETDFERNAASGVEWNRKVVIKELNRSTILDVIEKKRAQLRRQINYARNIFSGGIVSKGLVLLQALDFFTLACRASENDRSLFEQAEFEENQKWENGARTLIKCLGLLCYVDERA